MVGQTIIHGRCDATEGVMMAGNVYDRRSTMQTPW